MFFRGDTVKSSIGADVAVSDEMQKAIELWQKVLQDKSPWLDSNTQSLGLASSISAEFARLALTEFKSEVTGDARARFLQENYEFVLSKLQEQTEFAAAMGGLVFKPYVDGGKIAVDFVHAGRFIPTAYNSRGEVTGAVFVERVKRGKAWYTRLEHHKLSDSGYTIQNKAFVAYNEGELGSQTTLTSIDEWSSLEEETVVGYADGSTIEKPLFAYFKMPFANHIDEESPLGVSVFGRAIDLIKEADKQYSRILWEFEGSELAIDAPLDALNNSKMPARRKRLFRGLDIVRNNGDDLYQVFSPTIRDTSLYNGLNQQLRRIEFNCHLSYGTLSDPQNQEKTAEEIKMSKQRSYAAVCNIQKALEGSLQHLLWAMDYLAGLYNLAPAGDYEATFTWGDGILTDANMDFTQRKAMVDSNLLKGEKFLAWYFGVSEEEAKEMMPEANTGIGFGE